MLIESIITMAQRILRLQVEELGGWLETRCMSCEIAARDGGDASSIYVTCHRGSRP